MPDQDDLDIYYKKMFKQDKDILNNEYDNKTDRVKNALDKAWETRDFEIELYWKRAIYFWGFNAAIIIAIATILKEFKDTPLILSALYLLGIIFSIGWVMTNHSSKFWQKNWEKHIDYLEDNYYGKLYKTIHPELKNNFVPSISNVNLIVSYLVSIFWLLAYFQLFELLYKIENHCLYISSKIILLFIILFIFLIFAIKKK